MLVEFIKRLQVTGERQPENQITVSTNEVVHLLPRRLSGKPISLRSMGYGKSMGSHVLLTGNEGYLIFEIPQDELLRGFLAGYGISWIQTPVSRQFCFAEDAFDPKGMIFGIQENVGTYRMINLRRILDEFK